MQCGRAFFTVSVMLCAIVLAGARVWAQTAQADGSVKNPFAGDQAAVTLGKTIFEAACAGYCHATESSQRKGRCPNLFDCEWKYGSSDGEVFHSVTAGVPKTEMVGFKGKLPDEMLWKIIAYLRSASRCQTGQPAAVSAH